LKRFNKKRIVILQMATTAQFIATLKEDMVSFACICLQKELARINKKEKSSIFESCEKGLLNEQGEMDKELKDLNKFQQQTWFVGAVEIFFLRGMIFPRENHELFSDWVPITTDVDKLHAITMELNKYMDEKHGGRHLDGSWRDVCKIYTSEKLYNYLAFAVTSDDDLKVRIVEELKKEHEKYCQNDQIFSQIIEKNKIETI
jgi:hypothetical protein